MDSYGFLCIPIDSYGFLWIPTGFLWIHVYAYRFIWIPMYYSGAGRRNLVKRPDTLPGLSGSFPDWAPPGSCAYQCSFLLLSSLLFSRISMDSYGFLCIPMDYYRIPLVSYGFL